MSNSGVRIIAMLIILLNTGCSNINGKTKPYVTFKAVQETTKEPLANKGFVIRVYRTLTHHKMASGLTNHEGIFSFRVNKSDIYDIELYEDDYLIGIATIEAKELEDLQLLEVLFQDEPSGGYKKKESISRVK